jgi:hypothetical protein
MAGGKGTSYKNNFLTWALTTAAAPTRPTSWTVALYTDATGLASGGAGPTTEATTGNCPGYARQNVSFGSTAATGGTISNNGAVTFTATGAWATVNYYAILDQAGTIIDWAPLSTSRTLAVSGDKIDFAIGAITVTES